MSAADVVASVALLGGAATSLLAGLAVLRFPDTASRIHAATKPQVLGIVLLMIGLGIRLGTPAVIGELVLIVVLQFLTAPVSAHLAVRAAHRLTGAGPPWGGGDDATAGTGDPPTAGGGAGGGAGDGAADGADGGAADVADGGDDAPDAVPGEPGDAVPGESGDVVPRGPGGPPPGQ